ncbi:MAG: PfkB family carbohydrate kinase [Planctomycetota bacterium]
MQEHSRQQVAHDVADRLEAVEHTASLGAFIGFDGFIDTLIRVVDTRHAMATDAYAPIPTIDAFADRVRAAAGKNANLELVPLERRFGGNGPLMAAALAGLGAGVRYVGAIGSPDAHDRVHPLFRPFADQCAEAIAIAPPAETDALEFDDGKLMLGKPANVQLPTWALLRERVGVERLRAMAAQSGLIGLVNWVMMGGLPGIWQGLIDDILPGLPAPTHTPGGPRRVFVDLCDPRRRTDDDLRAACAQLAEMNALAPVTLGLNLAESQRLCALTGVAAPSDADGWTPGEALAAAAERVRGALRLDAIVIHTRRGAAGADAAGDRGCLLGPFTRRPAMSTGAGDHFNGGFAFGRLVGLDLAQALALGSAVSGAYVRDAASPDRARVCAFLRSLPAPEA